MRALGLRVALWAGFALLVVAGGYAMLRACDFGIFPLFGYGSCAAPPPDAALAAEQDRQTNLRAGIHSAEMRLAQLPMCPKPVTPPPPPPPAPKVEPPKPVEPPPPVIEKFHADTVKDLEGCWQSVRGDLEIRTDDAEQKLVGTARFCYCFKSDGNGTAQIHYNDGDYCHAPMKAKIVGDHVLMHHPNVICQQHGYYVATDIDCGKDQSGETTCELHNLGRNGSRFTEQFKRVTEEYCKRH